VNEYRGVDKMNLELDAGGDILNIWDFIIIIILLRFGPGGPLQSQTI
jgi:hypothetical protein